MRKYIPVILTALLLGSSIAYAQVTAPESEPMPEPVMETAAPADTSPPVISDVTVVSLGVTDASIMWTTDELATSKVRYGTTAALGSETALNPEASLAHTAHLTGLSPETVYHYCVDAVDTSGNAAESCGHTFTTAAEPMPMDSEPPVVTNISVSALTAQSATLSWMTDEPATGYVEYGMTPDYGSLTPLAEDFATEHSANLSGLSADTTYYYRIVVADAAGNSSATPGESFTTESAPVPEPKPEPAATSTPAMTEPAPAATSTPPAETPVLFSAVTAERISTSTVTIFWETDVPTDSLIQYGTTTELGSESAHDTGLVSTHEVALAGLAPSTAYYFRIVARPLGAANATNSELHDFATLAVPVFTDPAANISDVAHSTATETTVNVSWLTDELTSGLLEFGTTTAYGMTAAASSSATQHFVSLVSLKSGSTYHYRAKAVDAGGNITYSLDRTFTTVAAASTPTPIAEESASAPTTSTPSPAVSSGGGGGGGASPQPAKPLLITAAAGDSEILFEWNNPSISGFSEIILLRKQGGYPSSPSDGEVLYQGRSETFTDTDLPNGVVQYYALYTENGFGRFSVPLHVSLAPIAGREEVQKQKAPVFISDTAEEHFSDTLSRGATGIEVMHLQQILNVAGVHESGLTTGYFGPLTQASVRKFQGLHDLPRTGVADSATRAKLNAVSASHVITGAPESIALVSQDLSRGASGEEVQYLQQFLAYEGSYPEALITGYYGPLTQAAVARFQNTYGVTPAVGYMGPQTRHTIKAMMGL